MPETAEQLAKVLVAQTEPGTRNKLVAKGLARGMIWADGELPEDAPNFKEDLTDDLLDHGFSILSRACRLKDLGGAVESEGVTLAETPAVEEVRERVQKIDAQGRAYATGRRKTSTARVFLRPGNGTITVNHRDFDKYFTTDALRTQVRRPLLLTETGEKFDILATVDGGGVHGQCRGGSAEAAWP